MYKRYLAPLALTLLLCVAGCTKRFTGTFIDDHRPGWMMCVSLTQTGDHVSGFLATLQPNDRGETTARDVSVHGDVDGPNVVLHADTLFGLSNVTLTGHLSGNKLTLSIPTSGEISSVELTRGTMEHFKGAVADWQKVLHAENVARESAESDKAAGVARRQAAESALEEWRLAGHQIEMATSRVKAAKMLADDTATCDAALQNAREAAERVDRNVRNRHCDEVERELDSLQVNIDRLGAGRDHLADRIRDLEVGLADLLKERADVLEKCQSYEKASIAPASAVRLVRLKSEELLTDADVQVKRLREAIQQGQSDADRYDTQASNLMKTASSRAKLVPCSE
jgi:hypothetical protein